MIHDPIFHSYQAIAGPTSLFTYQLQNGKWIYIIGEDHISGTETIADTIRIEDAILHYAKYHPINLCIEMNDQRLEETAMYVMNDMLPKSPIHAIIQKMYQSTEKTLNKIGLICADIRSESPYHMLDIISNPTRIARRYLDMRHPATFVRRRDTIKQFEKQLLKAINSRENAIQFLLSIVLPNRDTPQWYQHTVDILEEQDSVLFTIKEKLAQLQPIWYGKIEEYVHTVWHHILYDRGSFHSKAIASIEKRRHTKSDRLAMNHLSFNRGEEIEAHFTRICAIIFDIQVFIELQTSLHEIDKPFVIMAGDTHARLFNYFIEKNQSIKIIAWNHQTNDPNNIPIRK